MEKNNLIAGIFRVLRVGKSESVIRSNVFEFGRRNWIFLEVFRLPICFLSGAIVVFPNPVSTIFYYTERKRIQWNRFGKLQYSASER